MTKKKQTPYKFECPHCKKDTGGQWPRNYRWKTERGFNNHNCYKDVLAAEKKRKEEQAAKLEERKRTAKYQPGDKVFFYSYRVTKPIYEENRWGRRVKVRYEEVRSYYAGEGEVTQITDCGYTVNRWTQISDSNICQSIEEARTKATKAQASYDEHCEFSAMCR